MPLPIDNKSTSGNCPRIPPKAVDQKKLRTNLAITANLPTFQQAASILETHIISTADLLYEFFHLNGYMIVRNEWDSTKTAEPLRKYKGWVYAFYGEGDFPIYVGETGRTLTSRFGEHKKGNQPWWDVWKRVKVLPCPDQSTRKIFESLLGLAGGYQANILQPIGGDNIFDDVILSLLLLGNNNGRLPTFPT